MVIIICTTSFFQITSVRTAMLGSSKLNQKSTGTPRLYIWRVGCRIQSRGVPVYGGRPISMYRTYHTIHHHIRHYTSTLQQISDVCSISTAERYAYLLQHTCHAMINQHHLLALSSKSCSRHLPVLSRSTPGGPCILKNYTGHCMQTSNFFAFQYTFLHAGVMAS